MALKINGSTTPDIRSTVTVNTMSRQLRQDLLNVSSYDQAVDQTKHEHNRVKEENQTTLTHHKGVPYL